MLGLYTFRMIKVLDTPVSSLFRRMSKVALASVYGQRGAIATAELMPGEAALSVPLASALVATTSGLSACPLPKSFVSHAYWKDSSG